MRYTVSLKILSVNFSQKLNIPKGRLISEMKMLLLLLANSYTITVALPQLISINDKNVTAMSRMVQ